MILNTVNIIFEIICVLIVLLLIVRTFFPDLFKNSNVNSPVMALLGGLFIFYVILCAILSVITFGFVNKIIFILFGISPFIIGKLVSYQKLKIYSIIQVLCVILSLVFVIII